MDSLFSMTESILSELWDEYLHTSPSERPQMALEAAEIFIEQGSELEYRAFLSLAVEDGLAIADTKIAVTAAVELARHLVMAGLDSEAVEVVAKVLSKLEPWRSFDLGVLYRALAWAQNAGGDSVSYREALRTSIGLFRSLGEVEWYEPLETELSLSFLNMELWSALAVTARCENKSWTSPN